VREGGGDGNSGGGCVVVLGRDPRFRNNDVYAMEGGGREGGRGAELCAGKRDRLSPTGTSIRCFKARKARS